MIDEQPVQLVLDVADRDHTHLALDAVERELVEEPTRPVREEHDGGPAPSSACAAAAASAGGTASAYMIRSRSE